MRHDPLPASPGQPGRDGGLVPGVGPQPHDAHLRPLAAQPLQQHRRGVGGPVVDAEDLVRHAPPVGHGAQPLDEERQHRLLVVDRDDDAQVDRGGGAWAKGRSRGRRHPAPSRRDAAGTWLRAPEYEIGGPRLPAGADVSSRSVPAVRTAGSATRRWRRPREGRTSTQAVGRGTHAVARVVTALARPATSHPASRAGSVSVIRTTCPRGPSPTLWRRCDPGGVTPFLVPK